MEPSESTRVEERDEDDKKDFIFQLLYRYDYVQIRQAYVSMIANVKEYVPQIGDGTVQLAHRVTSRDAMLLHMLLVLVMDDTNGFTQFALQHAHPKSRLAYFRVWFADFARNFVRVRLCDACVPNPRVILPAVISEYCRRRDNEAVFRKHKDFNDYVPLDVRR